MRKALIAAIVASALFAVGAFAASFTLTPENVASNSAAVGSCADEAVVNFTTSETINTDVNPDDFVVTDITVTFVDEVSEGVFEETTDCDTAKADLALENSGTGWQNLTSTTVGTRKATWSGLFIPVKPIINVAVLVDGVSISTTPPSP